MKPITPDNYLVRPFVTHKTQDITYTFLGSSNSSLATIDLALVPLPSMQWMLAVNAGYRNPDGIDARALYSSVMHVFYNSGSVLASGSSTDLRFNPRGSDFYVVSMAQQGYGEGIRPGSFRLTAGLSTASLYDDGNGRIVSTDATTKVVGNVFYKSGIAVIQAATGPVTASLVSANGLFATTGSVLELEFDATHTIYEHQVICTMEAGEFNYSMNPSIRRNGTPEIINQFVSGTLSPYMTTVGLYSDLGELVAIAKFPRPLKRASDSQQTIIFRLDI